MTLAYCSRFFHEKTGGWSGWRVAIDKMLALPHVDLGLLRYAIHTESQAPSLVVRPVFIVSPRSVV